MDERLEEILAKIRRLENELILEIQKKEKDFLYEIRQKKILFTQEAKKQQKLLVKKIRHYLFDASLLNIITAPVVWFCLVPAVLMDLVLSVYQAICFPIYGIPKVQRSEFIVIDRHYLRYLNAIEKLNCVYCGYFNGVIGYAQEVGARTEQYWCPIKHARKVKFIHRRYKKFFDYGDGPGYRDKIDEVRKSFEDLKPGKNHSG